MFAPRLHLATIATQATRTSKIDFSNVDNYYGDTIPARKVV